MTKVSWIRIEIDMFDNRKIRHIRKLPEGNNIVLIWMMLLTMAGRCNSNGIIFLTENIPYTNKMLADELDFDESVIELALTILEKFGMITRDGSELSIPGWEEHQNIDGLEKIREQTRKRVSEHRKRQKELLEEEILPKLTDQDTEEKPVTAKDSVKPGDVQKVIDEWNKLQKLGIQPVIRMTPKRSQLLKARIREYGMEKIMEAIEKVKKSDFLTGRKKDFIITFEFFINPNKFIKILEGFYDNRDEDVHNGFNRKTQRDVSPLIPLGEWDGGESDTPFA
nr:MAG TPA: replisome organizer [Caudoviricetes sp.]